MHWRAIRNTWPNCWPLKRPLPQRTLCAITTLHPQRVVDSSLTTRVPQANHHTSAINVDRSVDPTSTPACVNSVVTCPR